MSIGYSTAYRFDDRALAEDNVGVFNLEVLPNIFRTSFKAGAEWAFDELEVYAVRSDKKVLFIDAGCPEVTNFRVFQAMLDEYGLSWDNAALFVTHFHRDHCGFAREFYKKGVPVYSTAGRIKYDESNIARFHYLSGACAACLNGSYAGYLATFEASCNIDYPAIEVEDGFVFDLDCYQLEVVHLPGHAAEHSGLIERSQRILFCGDMVLEKYAPICCADDIDAHAMVSYGRSLKKMAQMAPLSLFSSHMLPLWGVDAARRAFEDAWAYQNRQIENIFKTLCAASGACSVVDIEKLYYSDTDSKSMDSRGRRAIKIFSYCEYLYDNKRVSRRIDGMGTALYYHT
ncbi:MBL fold metallo-hydrolase [Gordonibacter sp. 28C]|uniref:MBL fold metallo-hydrolase n=1 Tax=Gordonibacter sp. 28C TaxID=2078569 RepID=UPI001314BD0A|nr:MBL fold metallo-hydrolase [Gordonibacter sp. 28C]